MLELGAAGTELTGKALPAQLRNPPGSAAIAASFLCLLRPPLCLGFGPSCQFRLQQGSGLDWGSSHLFDLVSNWAKNAWLKVTSPAVVYVGAQTQARQILLRLTSNYSQQGHGCKSHESPGGGTSPSVGLPKQASSWNRHKGGERQSSGTAMRSEQRLGLCFAWHCLREWLCPQTLPACQAGGPLLLRASTRALWVPWLEGSQVIPGFTIPKCPTQPAASECHTGATAAEAAWGWKGL